MRRANYVVPVTAVTGGGLTGAEGHPGPTIILARAGCAAMVHKVRWQGRRLLLLQHLQLTTATPRQQDEGPDLVGRLASGASLSPGLDRQDTSTGQAGGSFKPPICLGGSLGVRTRRQLAEPLALDVAPPITLRALNLPGLPLWSPLGHRGAPGGARPGTWRANTRL